MRSTCRCRNASRCSLLAASVLRLPAPCSAISLLPAPRSRSLRSIVCDPQRPSHGDGGHQGQSGSREADADALPSSLELASIAAREREAVPRRPGSGRLSGDRDRRRRTEPLGQIGHRLGPFSRVFLQTVANRLDQHVGHVGRPLVQVVDRSRLGRTQAGQGITASQRRPATEKMPPHAAASEQIARHGRRRALGDPLRSKGAAGIGHKIVVRYSLLRADHAAQARMGNMDFAVVCDQDVLHADIAVDQATASLPGRQVRRASHGRFPGRPRAENGRDGARNRPAKFPRPRARRPRRANRPGRPQRSCRRSAAGFFRRRPVFRVRGRFCPPPLPPLAGTAAGFVRRKHRQPNDFPRFPVFRPIDGRIATFLDTLTQNVVRNLPVLHRVRRGSRRPGNA